MIAAAVAGSDYRAACGSRSPSPAAAKSPAAPSTPAWESPAACRSSAPRGSCGLIARGHCTKPCGVRSTWRPPAASARRCWCRATSAPRRPERHFSLAEEQLVEVGNAWGFLLDLLAERARGHSVFDAVLLLGHPGKLAKLALGQWDTHSSRSPTATPLVARLHQEVLGRPARREPDRRGHLRRVGTNGKDLAGPTARRRRATGRRAPALPSPFGRGAGGEGLAESPKRGNRFATEPPSP